MNCQRCGIELVNPRPGKDKFCSLACWRAYQSENRPWTACQYCGVFFQVKPAKLRTGRGKFCGKWCESAGRPVKSLADRFWPKVQKSDGCWNWTGTKDRKGYGRLAAGRRGEVPRLAHRISYEFANGPIPDGLGVLHKCDNPSCVRPDHLFVGTAKDNTDDCVTKDRFSRGERTPMAKLTADQVREIRRRAGQETYAALGGAFDVAATTIQCIVERRTWKHIN